MSKHRIRLAGPWDFQTLDSGLAPRGETTECRLPVILVDLTNETGIQLQRGFHKPTGIDGKLLRLVLQANTPPRAVLINDVRIAESAVEHESEYAFEITTHIKPFNWVCILLTVEDYQPSPVLNTVWLEILE
ncbi:MAG: hypothetical protein KDB01_10790 [Planctomycetaceae bacterium]|nr:hypothetical protein [Planctomycetaceae bacterium]